MRGVEGFRIALRALAINKMRSFLTMLGIIIGISTAVILISAGQGVERYIYDLFSGIGVNVLFVVPGQLDQRQDPFAEPEFGELTLSDAHALANPWSVPDVALVSPEVTARARIVRGDESLNVDLMGMAPEHGPLRGWSAEQGNFISQDDMDAALRVVILGQEPFQKLYEPSENPIGTTVRIDNVVFTVIGIMEEIGASQYGNRDNTVFMPFTTAQERLLGWKTVNGDYRVSQILVSVVHEDRMAQAQIDIEELLRKRHRIGYFEEDDFAVISQTDFIGVFGGITRVVTIFLGSISFVSLLVGGIGIMNIMLVSVAERTQEIGLRKAIGARRRDILQQFLIEAIFLSLLGGLVGIGLGGGVTTIVNTQLGDFDLALQPATVMWVCLFCMGTGIGFGFWPSVRASRLSPIEALRTE